MNTDPGIVQEGNFIQRLFRRILRRIQQSAIGRMIVLLMAILAGILAGYILVLLVEGLFPPRSPAASLLEVFLLVAVVTGFYLGAARWFEQRALPVEEFSLPGAGLELGVGLLAGAALFALAIGVLWLLGVYRIEAQNGLGVLFPALAASLPSAYFQELAFRGVILRISEERMGTFTALLAASAIPGLLRAVNNDATPLDILSATLIAGALMSTAYLLTRRLWLPIGIHIAWEFVRTAIFGVGTVMIDNESVSGLFRAALNGSPLLTGGTPGVEASIVTLVVTGAAGAALGIWAWKKWGYE